MARVLPGQYLAPLYQNKDDSHVVHYVAGPGTTVCTIKTDTKAGTIPVIVASIMGEKMVVPSQADPEINNGIETATCTVSVVTSNDIYAGFNGANGSNNNTTTGDNNSIDDTHHGSNSGTANAKDIKVQTSAICLPQEHDVVLLRVTRINPKQANGEILVVEKFGTTVKDSGVGLNGEFAHRLLAVGGGSQLLQSVSAVALLQTTLISANTPELGETFKGVIRSQDVRLTEKDKVRIIDSFKPGDIVRAVVILLGDGLNYYLSTARDDLGVVFAKAGKNPMYALDWQHMVCEKTGEVEKRKCAKPFT